MANILVENLSDVGKYWTDQWNTVKARLYTIVGNFLGHREKIQRHLDALQKAQARAADAGLTDREQQIRAAIQEGNDLLTRQGEIENDLQAAQQKIQEIDAPGVGFVAVVAIAGAVVVVAAVVGAIVIHTQYSDRWQKKADLLEQGLISPAEMSGGVAGALSSAAMPWLLLLGVGAFAWWWVKR